MLVLKSWKVGITACQREWFGPVSRASSAARRPWMVILLVPRAFVTSGETVVEVKRAFVGTVRMTEPSW